MFYCRTSNQLICNSWAVKFIWKWISYQNYQRFFNLTKNGLECSRWLWRGFKCYRHLYFCWELGRREPPRGLVLCPCWWDYCRNLSIYLTVGFNQIKFLYFSSLLFLRFGFLIGDTVTLKVHSFGLLLGLFYLSVFVYYTPSENRSSLFKQTFYGLIFAAVCILYTFVWMCNLLGNFN